MLVKELARGLSADGIRVNAIAPGAIPGGGFEAGKAALAAMIPLGRTGTPEDIADGSHAAVEAPCALTIVRRAGGQDAIDE
jgi:NAD(P)-dependent dehydrogenase (short-subunit alcohol dehydrogenase family)